MWDLRYHVEMYMLGATIGEVGDWGLEKTAEFVDLRQ